jgi:hypothetical protein
MAPDALAWLKLNRKAAEGHHTLSQVAPGIEKSPALPRIFTTAADRASIGAVKVEVAIGPGYAYVDDADGTLVLSQDYLATGDKVSLYLDLVHELTHVRQYREGKDLYDRRFSYVDRPTEIEAYRVAVDEARRLGMKDPAILEYLLVEWVSRAELERLAIACGVEVGD